MAQGIADLRKEFARLVGEAEAFLKLADRRGAGCIDQKSRRSIPDNSSLGGTITPVVIAFEKQGGSTYNEPRDLQNFGCPPGNPMTKLPADILDRPIEERAEMALKAAVDKMINEHARRSLPICVWRNGAVVEIPPDELRAWSNHTGAEST
ncbi:MAG: hypothetical protein ACRD1N_02530 [Terriglobia bacterium]